MQARGNDLLEKNQLKQDERARVGAFYGQFPVFVILPVNAQSSPNLCVKYFFPGTSCAGDANASMSVHYHS